MALVPPAVVTVTSAVPLPAGDIAVIEVALLTVKDAAPVVPNFTEVAQVKSVPVIVTGVPPPVGPEAGAIEVTAGTAITVRVAAGPATPAAAAVALGVPAGIE